MHEHTTIEISLSSIEIGVFSPRKTFNAAYVSELAESIEMRGLLKPLTVRSDPLQASSYQLIDGEHRLRALKLKGFALARCEIVCADDREALIIAFTTNDLHGKKLEPLEEAQHIKRLMAEQRYTQEDVGKVLRKSQAWISKRMSLVEKLELTVQDKIIRRRINPSHAEELMSFEKPIQKEIADKVEKEKLSRKQTRILARAIKSHPERAQVILEKPISPFDVLVSTADQLQKALEAAPEEVAIEVVKCPHCCKELWVNWFGHEISKKQEDRDDESIVGC
jgi:ParB family chromosome partitioning protein